MVRPDKRRARFGARWPYDIPARDGRLLAFGIHYRQRWAVMPGMRGACGYVKIGIDHPWYAPGEPSLIIEADADVHGGLTYVDHAGWVGFDTGHTGDVWADEPGEIGKLPRRYRRVFKALDHLLPFRRQWTVPRVVDECLRLAGHAAEVRVTSRSSFIGGRTLINTP